MRAAHRTASPRDGTSSTAKPPFSVGAPRVAALGDSTVGGHEHGRHLFVDSSGKHTHAGSLGLVDHRVRVAADRLPLTVWNDHRSAWERDKVLGHGVLPGTGAGEGLLAPNARVEQSTDGPLARKKPLARGSAPTRGHGFAARSARRTRKRVLPTPDPYDLRARRYRSAAESTSQNRVKPLSTSGCGPLRMLISLEIA